MHRLLNLQSKSTRLGIGLMSGTSVDGIDAALVKIQGCGLQTQVELLHFINHAYPAGLREQLLEISKPGGGNVETICRMNVLVGELFAQASLALLEAAEVDPEKVDFIGSHGQTIHHLPESEKMFGIDIRATLQIGEASVICKRTGILTVADFRPADLALQGQGAPLVPYFDFLIFRSEEKNRALVNVGGISNFTLLKAAGSIDDVHAYDTGPGNMLIDWLMQMLFAIPYDFGGEIALQGNVSPELLDFAMKHPYLEILPPKSTGREAFGSEFAQSFLQEAKRLNMQKNDIIASASEFTVRSLAEAYRRDVAPDLLVDEFIISGGGTHNRYLMNRFEAELAPAVTKTTDVFGLSSDAKEAICFAVLANETLSGNSGNVPSATGASGATILGKLCF